MFSFLKNLGTVEIIIIGLIILLLVGGKKLNELARGLGESKKELKKITKEVKGKDKKEDEKEEEEKSPDA